MRITTAGREPPFMLDSLAIELCECYLANIGIQYSKNESYPAYGIVSYWINIILSMVVDMLRELDGGTDMIAAYTAWQWVISYLKDLSAEVHSSIEAAYALSGVVGVREVLFYV